MSQKTDLFVALDVPTQSQAEQVVESLAGLNLGFKVGLELYSATGPEFVRSLVDKGFRVFLDLKLHDIPNTVARASARICELGVSMFTIHLAGGKSMVQATAEEVSKHTNPPRILGVTVLTSMRSEEWAELGHPLPLHQYVFDYASFAKTWGLTGVVCSGHELDATPADLFRVVPGIRPAGFATQDQTRVMSPREAAQKGAGAIVVGRPITQAATPEASRRVAEQVLSELKL